MAVKLEGLDTVLKRLSEEISKIEGDVQKGLTLGMLNVKADSMKMTPVDTGNLRASHYLVAGDGITDQETGGFDTSDASGRRVAEEHSGHIASALAGAISHKKPFVEIGCTAHYAEKVHEDLEARHVSGNAKFLELAIRNNEDKIPVWVKRFASR
jgi:hypothetical protein